MTNPTSDVADVPTDDFASELRTLLLGWFARGVDIERTWELASPSSLVPDWRVTIEKTTDADLPHEGAVFLDE